MDSLIWVKSSYSSGSGDNCVEIATLVDGGRFVRDSKDPGGPVLRFAAGEWSAFVLSLKGTGLTR